MRSLAFLSSGLLVLALLGSCRETTSGDGSMSVRLVDGPINGFQEVNVTIQKVEISSGGGWVTLGTPNQTYNLLSLTGGLSATLASGATLSPGHYNQMRLVLGSGNTVKLADGTVAALTVPSGLQTGIKLIVSFDVAAGTTKDVWIDFDAAHSIQLTSAGASSQYILRPTVRAYDKVATGSVSGALTNASGGAGLAGAMVFAETLDGSGTPAIVRTAVTDPSGAYTLDLLPVGSTYYVVSMPRVGSTAFDPKASGALNLTTASPVLTYSAAFTANASTGGVSGALTPVAGSTQSDTVNLSRSLASQTFIMDTTMASIDSGITSNEIYAFANVPIGSYAVQAVRTTLNGDGSATRTVSGSVSATVSAGATTVANLTF